MLGVRLHYKSWKGLFDDKERGSLLVPMLVLVHEHDPDPEMRPLKGNIDVELREKLILGIATGVTAIYRYFAPQRRRMEARFAVEGIFHTIRLPRRCKRGGFGFAKGHSLLTRATTFSQNPVSWKASRK